MNTLELDDIAVSYGGLRALDGISFAVPERCIFSIIGPNGAGKTTLFNVLTGLAPHHEGRVRFLGQDVTGLAPNRLAARGLARTFQNLQIFPRMSVLDNVRVGRHLKDRPGVLRGILRPPGTGAAESASRAAAMAELDRVGLADKADVSAGALAYGMMKRLEIARALAGGPKLLLLDEPAAGCNPTETADLHALILALARDGLGIVLVEHDMRLVMSVSDRVLVMVEGRVLIVDRPEVVRNNRRVIASYLGEIDADIPDTDTPDPGARQQGVSSC